MEEDLPFKESSQGFGSPLFLDVAFPKPYPIRPHSPSLPTWLLHPIGKLKQEIHERSRLRWQEKRKFCARKAKISGVMAYLGPQVAPPLYTIAFVGKRSCPHKHLVQVMATFLVYHPRFHVLERKHLEVVDQALNMYFRDNIPVESFELSIDINNMELALSPKNGSIPEKWIGSVATKSCNFKEFSLSLAQWRLLRVLSASNEGVLHSVWIKTPINGIINCVSLREVVLNGVRISQKVLDVVFSSCNLLENIELWLYELDEGRGFITIKIKNLARLHKLRI
ncbi:hypothetical protein LXL04_032949 [Taraxacum kok-saghyz]